MSASPVLIEQQSDNVPQKVIEAYMSFVRERATGVLEIHFNTGGVGQVIAKKSELYK